MMLHKRVLLFVPLTLMFMSCGEQLQFDGEPAVLEVRESGSESLRITLKPASFPYDLPDNPSIASEDFPRPAIKLARIGKPKSKKVGNFQVDIHHDPLTIAIKNSSGTLLQQLVFNGDGTMTFHLDDNPVLGMGEGGPRHERGSNAWRTLPVEFDRRGRFHNMHPRWQSNAYGSRNPVPLLIGTGGWAMYVAAPWGQFDMTESDKGTFIPFEPLEGVEMQQSKNNQHDNLGKGIPPVSAYVKGLLDIFVFDGASPQKLMAELAGISGKAVMPPLYSMGYMQSHRTLEDEHQMIDIVKTFREKEIPVDAVIYLGTGFCPRGWNKEQPSFEFNPEVFFRDPAEVIADLHALNVKVSMHVVPWDRDVMPSLRGNIPPGPGEVVDESHIFTHWSQHIPLVMAGVDAWWPDEGDWFNLYERLKRHQLYYEGPIYTTPNVRPWSLHRNGYLGIARWGGWVWSGDTQSDWKTLEAQIAVGLNHSLSLSPYWGSDIGGFYPGHERTGEMYARWFQFGAFCPSFRSHARTWWTGLPWGWGLSEMGPLENRGIEPYMSELNNPTIEPVCKQYAELRYQLLPYNYTLAWEARSSGMPFMRAMWLHYPEDTFARGLGNQYMWGRDMLVAPVFEPGATSREVYLPKGQWYDWFTNELHNGGNVVSKAVDLSIMPIYVRAGSIIPFDPVRQYTAQATSEPTTLRIYRGANGEFTMYEDDGISLEYLDEKYKLTRFEWDDAAKNLRIEPVHTGVASEGNRIFKVLLLPEGTVHEIAYSGSKQEYKLN
jgi:alpha-glucosidase (family GH31 glycosyl hydrolase)